MISDEKVEDLTQGKDYTVNDRQVTLATPTGLKIKIYRATTTKPLVGWADASVLRAADMTVQSTQLLHLAEETSDLAQDGGLSKDTTDNVWDARFNKIKNLLDPTEPGDAVPLRYITNKQTGLLTQLNATGDSQNTRLLKTGDAQNNRLVTTGDSYVNTMTTLKNTATNKATEATNQAELAKKWAVSDVSPDDVEGHKSSKTWAEESKVSANASKASADASQTSATNSSNSASVSAQKATDAANSATAAAYSASKASSSATAAKASETNAASSASAAAQSAENAKTWDPTQYVQSVTESNGKVTVTKGGGESTTFNAGLNILARNKAYKVGDIAYSPNLPSYLYLECTAAGTTGATEPDMSTLSGGVIVNDGTAQFSVKTVCAKEYVDAVNTTVTEMKEKYIFRFDVFPKARITRPYINAVAVYNPVPQGYKRLGVTVYCSGTPISFLPDLAYNDGDIKDTMVLWAQGLFTNEELDRIWGGIISLEVFTIFVKKE